MATSSGVENMQQSDHRMYKCHCGRVFAFSKNPNQIDSTLDMTSFLYLYRQKDNNEGDLRFRHGYGNDNLIRFFIVDL